MKIIAVHLYNYLKLRQQHINTQYCLKLLYICKIEFGLKKKVRVLELYLIFTSSYFFMCKCSASPVCKVTEVFLTFNKYCKTN